ncbi:unnamed protein product [Ostreobium quekettii]|uniref:Uncharacterized protein n=1 Tax=Ostreobium quekettii TaxID=121088 RepID=A0A8S1IN10_9CHLO|nr:unnamed protein product [Ostreobium quekettii]|eukprot:evm.model.scf_81.2 EVM.evm.TU.scf_81.2   scf_81:13945-16193(+)
MTAVGEERSNGDVSLASVGPVRKPGGARDLATKLASVKRYISKIGSLGPDPALEGWPAEYSSDDEAEYLARGPIESDEGHSGRNFDETEYGAPVLDGLGQDRYLPPDSVEYDPQLTGQVWCSTECGNLPESDGADPPQVGDDGADDSRFADGSQDEEAQYLAQVATISSVQSDTGASGYSFCAEQYEVALSQFFDGSMAEDSPLTRRTAADDWIPGGQFTRASSAPTLELAQIAAEAEAEMDSTRPHSARPCGLDDASHLPPIVEGWEADDGLEGGGGCAARRGGLRSRTGRFIKKCGRTVFGGRTKERRRRHGVEGTEEADGSLTVSRVEHPITDASGKEVCSVMVRTFLPARASPAKTSRGLGARLRSMSCGHSRTRSGEQDDDPCETQ